MTDQQPFPQPGPQPPHDSVPVGPVPTGPLPTGPVPTGTGPGSEKRKSTVGLIGLIAAIAGALVAWIPLIGVIGWPLFLTGLILGIVGVTRAGEKKGTSIAAIIVSVLGPILAIIISVALIADSTSDALKNVTLPSTTPTVSTPSTADDDSDDAAPPADDDSTPEDSEDEPSTDDEVGTTRENPAPIGSTISTDKWEVTIDSVEIDAAKTVKKKYKGSEADPDEGNVWVLVTMTAKYIGDDKGGDMPWATVDYVTADGNTIDTDTTGYFLDGSFDSTSKLYTGASTTGTILFQVPKDTADQGVLSVSPDLFGDSTFVAVK
ncbi:hypothetical protein GCM10010401_06730 [Rarobacter faecitabidus]|uniref:Uncharacterized protein DUF4352 n=1 Tax=Rarobacter faecitabidus TaxID=13243 RepID=A0A542ZTI6_RARFA|nr:DUF4352 domain-containing protein [Rarobacter faecitabidus]TQL63579.1 uncharacterized protein DUF4352 [Rarobacter faecitabidus]